MKISEATKKNMNLLSINDFPFSENELHTQYKSSVQKYHPDRNKELGAEEKTKEINIAYGELKNLALPEITDIQSRIVKENYELEKEDIFFFWKPCKNCNGTGKQVIDSNSSFLSLNKPKFIVKTCHECKGLGEYKIQLFNPVIPKGSILSINADRHRR